MVFEDPGFPDRPNMRPRWLQSGLKLGEDELSWVKMRIRALKMGKMSDKMIQDGPRCQK